MNKFDIDFVVSTFQAINLKHHFGPLKEWSRADLRQLRRQVKKHSKHNPHHQAFSDVRNFSTHDAIISAINHELLRRSFYHPFYKFLLCLRTRIVKTFTGLLLEEHEYFGALYKQPKKLHHYYLHMPHKEFLPIVGRFILRNLKFIIGTVLTILGLYLAYLQIIKT